MNWDRPCFTDRHREQVWTSVRDIVRKYSSKGTSFAHMIYMGARLTSDLVTLSAMDQDTLEDYLLQHTNLLTEECP